MSVSVHEYGEGSRPNLGRLAVRRGRRTVFLWIDDVDSLEADGNYVRVHTGAKSFLVRESLGSMCDRFPSRDFVRIHRSAVVNLARVRTIIEEPGRSFVVLESGRTVPLSESCHDRLRMALGLLVCRPAGPASQTAA